MGRNKYFVLLVLGLVLMLVASFVACSRSPATTESPPQSLPEPEEPEEQPIYISSLAYELKHQILLGDLVAFLERYPVNREGDTRVIFLGGWELAFGHKNTRRQCLPGEDTY